jgi:hypothetical protein
VRIAALPRRPAGACPRITQLTQLPKSWRFEAEWDLAPNPASSHRDLRSAGANHSYLLRGNLLVDEPSGRTGGLLLWNGLRRNLDMLLSVDLESADWSRAGRLPSPNLTERDRRDHGGLLGGEQPIGKPARSPRERGAVSSTFKRAPTGCHIQPRQTGELTATFPK